MGGMQARGSSCRGRAGWAVLGCYVRVQNSHNLPDFVAFARFEYPIV